jgi:3-oxoacyl-[acyl-carrier protein] reductase
MKDYALVTGANSGIGAAIADELAGAGYTVLLNYYRNQGTAEAVKQRIEATGGHAELAPFDVTDRQATERTIGGWLADELPIGVVVNNAAVTRDSLFPDIKPQDWDLVVRTILDGFYNITRPLVMPMARRRRGRIVNISSVVGLAGNQGQVNYSAAKAGLIGATRSLAKEVASRGVTVNAIAPGYIETDMLEGLRINEIKKRIGMRRLGTPLEVAKLVGFLVGDDAAYITGQVIGIDGGLL